MSLNKEIKIKNKDKHWKNYQRRTGIEKKMHFGKKVAEGTNAR